MSECLAVSEILDPTWRTPTRSVPIIGKQAPSSVVVSSAAASPQERRWYQSIENAFSELENLKPGWDGRGARPISPAAIAFARDILFSTGEIPLPQIVPVSSGAIQLEWHMGGIDMELEINEPYVMHLYFEDAHATYDHQVTGPDLTPVFWAFGVLRRAV